MPKYSYAQAVERCIAEIEAAEAQLRAGHPDMQGLLLCLADWHTERRLIEKEERHGNATSSC